MRAGESLEAAVVRELLEETALAVRVVCALGPVAIEAEGFRYMIHEHLAIPASDPPPALRAGDDAAAARWISRDELTAWGLLPNALEVVERAFTAAWTRSLLGDRR